ncbi:hypothetical protein MCOR19_010574 [Pyricularia oryzae]|nr:hypothetical protein MCOR19_010574 [Pyricularia oryzae]KAI6471365.1 hypothetical protein MCOR18_008760 [Pyricularia oryzae]
MFGRAAKPSNPLLLTITQASQPPNWGNSRTRPSSQPMWQVGFGGVAQMRGRSADGHKQPSGGCARLKIEHYATRRGGG